MSIQWPEYIQIVDGDPVFAGTRIPVPTLLYFYNSEGHCADMLALDYPSLDLATIHKFLGFYHENHEPIDAFVTQHEAELEKIRAASPNRISMSEMRKRLINRAQAASA